MAKMFYINYFGEGNGNPLQCYLPGEFHGWSSLVGYSPSGHKESDMTQHTHTHTHTHTVFSLLIRTVKTILKTYISLTLENLLLSFFSR